MTFTHAAPGVDPHKARVIHVETPAGIRHCESSPYWKREEEDDGKER